MAEVVQSIAASLCDAISRANPQLPSALRKHHYPLTRSFFKKYRAGLCVFLFIKCRVWMSSPPPTFGIQKTTGKNFLWIKLMRAQKVCACRCCTRRVMAFFLMSQGRRLALNSPGIFSFIARACPSVIGSRFFSVTALVSLKHFSTLRWETTVHQTTTRRSLSDGCRRRLSDVKVFLFSQGFFPDNNNKAGEEVQLMLAKLFTSQNVKRLKRRQTNRVLCTSGPFGLRWLFERWWRCGPISFSSLLLIIFRAPQFVCWSFFFLNLFLVASFLVTLLVSPLLNSSDRFLLRVG